MKRKFLSSLTYLLSFHFLFVGLLFAQMPVINSHPRILLDAATKATLLTKKSNNDPDWLAVKAEADNYATLPILTWNSTNASVWNTNYIFYSYCGSSWEDAAYALGMAHQLTKGNTTGAFPTAYSNKLLEFADSLISAYNQYPPCSGCPNIFLYNSTYATRHIGNVVGVMYDWCYDELGPTRKSALLNLMNDWFDYMRVPYNVYQNTVHPTGNYYFGHVLCAANMGYASMYDSPKAQEMIDFARQRVLGTQSGSLLPADLTTNYLKQSYTGGLPTSASSSYLGQSTYKVAPQKDGMPVQGWGYSGGSLKRLIDYCFMVKSATGEAIADSLYPFISKSAECFTHALTPNRFQIDNSNDWGSFVGNVLGYDLPLHLSAVLAGTPKGPEAQYFYKNWIQPVNLAAAWNHGYPSANWAKLYYENATNPAAPFQYPPFYPKPSTNVLNTVPINQAMPKYYMREDWSDTATWSVLNMSCAYYDDHDHHNAGHFQIVRGDNHDGDDLLLVGSNEAGNGGSFGLNGIEGGTCYHFTNSLSNTLFFNDFYDYTISNTNGYMVGGQSFYGYDEPTHTEQNDTFSYVRADLTSAYYRKGEIADTVNRTLKHFYRSFLYLRNSDIFLVYDKILAKNSTNVQGQYKKHLRWHFLENPTINGNNITAIEDNSKLFIHTVIPTNASILKVDESNNPDNTFGSSLNYAFNTYTWRAEVSFPNNPLKTDFLTVLQPSKLTGVEMNTNAIASTTGNMEGTLVSVNGKQELVLFNKSDAKYPSPITSTSYTFNWQIATAHTLCGVVPNGKYQVDYNGITVNVTQSNTGNVTASPSGVLRFAVSKPTGIQDDILYEQGVLSVFPNPSTGDFRCNWAKAPHSFDYLEVTNNLGQIIQKYSLTDTQQEMLISIRDVGVYYVTLKGESVQTPAQKIVIVK